MGRRARGEGQCERRGRPVRRPPLLRLHRPLDNAATFAFNGDHLQLRAVNGALLVEYRATLE